MKRYGKLVIVFASAALIVLVAYLAREASTPLSGIIAKERNALYRSRDINRTQDDPRYARELEERLRFLDYRMALAYNAENKPAAAIKVLEKLISGEREKSDVQRNSRSYLNEARYYEALVESYELEKDEETENQMRHERIKALSKASELRKQESRGEGRSVETNPD